MQANKCKREDKSREITTLEHPVKQLIQVNIISGWVVRECGIHSDAKISSCREFAKCKGVKMYLYIGEINQVIKFSIEQWKSLTLHPSN